MATNLETFGDVDMRALTKPKYDKGEDLYDRWRKFHRLNPHIYESLKSMSLNLKKRGYNKIGIDLLWGRLRWLSYLNTNGEEEYRLNNNYRAFYARHLMYNVPELQDFFEIRWQESQVSYNFFSE